jgi:hypothetical protein
MRTWNDCRCFALTRRGGMSRSLEKAAPSSCIEVFGRIGVTRSTSRRPSTFGIGLPQGVSDGMGQGFPSRRNKVQPSTTIRSSRTGLDKRRNNYLAGSSGRRSVGSSCSVTLRLWVMAA